MKKIVWLLEPMNVVLLNYHDNERANGFHSDYVTFKDVPTDIEIYHMYVYIIFSVFCVSLCSTKSYVNKFCLLCRKDFNE